jgi:hypothetical protein
MIEKFMNKFNELANERSQIFTDFSNGVTQFEEEKIKVDQLMKILVGLGNDPKRIEFNSKFREFEATIYEDKFIDLITKSYKDKHKITMIDSITTNYIAKAALTLARFEAKIPGAVEFFTSYKLEKSETYDNLPVASRHNIDIEIGKCKKFLFEEFYKTQTINLAKAQCYLDARFREKDIIDCYNKFTKPKVELANNKDELKAPISNAQISQQIFADVTLPEIISNHSNINATIAQNQTNIAVAQNQTNTPLTQVPTTIAMDQNQTNTSAAQNPNVALDHTDMAQNQTNTSKVQNSTVDIDQNQNSTAIAQNQTTSDIVLNQNVTNSSEANIDKKAIKITLSNSAIEIINPSLNQVLINLNCTDGVHRLVVEAMVGTKIDYSGCFDIIIDNAQQDLSNQTDSASITPIGENN